MDIRDTISNYKSKLLDGDSDYQRSDDSSVASTVAGNLAMQDMFGNDEVSLKAKPLKGRKYLFYTIFMTVFLSIMVLYNVDE